MVKSQIFDLKNSNLKQGVKPGFAHSTLLPDKNVAWGTIYSETVLKKGAAKREAAFHHGIGS
jgi:hypothetical protein